MSTNETTAKRIKAIRGTALLAVALAVGLTLSACGEAKPYKPQSTDSSSSNKLTEPATASSSSQPAKTEAPKPTEPTKSAAPTSSPTAAQGSSTTPAASPAPSTAPAVTQPVATQPAAPVVTTPAAATASPAPAATPQPTPTAVATPAPATTPQATASAPPKTEDNTAKAEALFKSTCIACHGDQLQGGIGPNLQKVGSRKTKEQIMTQITKGGAKMPSFESDLDKASIETLATWLAAKK